MICVMSYPIFDVGNYLENYFCVLYLSIFMLYGMFQCVMMMTLLVVIRSMVSQWWA